MSLYEKFVDNPKLLYKYLKAINTIEKIKIAISINDYELFNKYYRRYIKRDNVNHIYLIELIMNNVLIYMIKYLDFNDYIKYLNTVMEIITSFDENIASVCFEKIELRIRLLSLYSSTNYKYIEPIINYMLEHDIKKMEWFMDIMCLMHHMHKTVDILSIMKIGETSNHKENFIKIMNGKYRTELSHVPMNPITRIEMFIEQSDKLTQKEIIDKKFIHGYRFRCKQFKYTDCHNDINNFMKKICLLEAYNDTTYFILYDLFHFYDYYGDSIYTSGQKVDILPFSKILIKKAIQIKAPSFINKAVQISNDHIYNIQLGENLYWRYTNTKYKCNINKLII